MIRGFLFVSVLIMLAGCVAKERGDTIEFKSPVKAVEDTITMVTALMDKTIVHPVDEAPRYYFDNRNMLIINRAVLGKRGSVDADTVGCLQNLPAAERNKLVSAIYFLDGNHITEAWKEHACKSYLYKYVPDTLHAVNRYLLVNDSKQDYKRFYKLYEKKDRKGNLVLVGRKP